jgi:hypothetical protein
MPAFAGTGPASMVSLSGSGKACSPAARNTEKGCMNVVQFGRRPFSPVAGRSPEPVYPASNDTAWSLINRLPVAPDGEGLEFVWRGFRIPTTD